MLSGLIIIAGHNVAHRGLLIEAAQGEEAVAPVLGPCVLKSPLAKHEMASISPLRHVLEQLDVPATLGLL